MCVVYFVRRILCIFVHLFVYVCLFGYLHYLMWWIKINIYSFTARPRTLSVPAFSSPAFSFPAFSSFPRIILLFDVLQILKFTSNLPRITSSPSQYDVTAMSLCGRSVAVGNGVQCTRNVAHLVQDAQIESTSPIHWQPCALFHSAVTGTCRWFQRFSAMLAIHHSLR